MKASSLHELPIPKAAIPFVLDQTQLILRSYQKCLGKPLMPFFEDAEIQTLALFERPFVVATSNAAEDPILTYGNQKALDLWEMSWEIFTQTPGRHTAEPVEREARERFLETVREQGYIDDYQGIRISATGKRFEIQSATVWNLVDDAGVYQGQAATFSDWTFLG